MAAAPRVTWEPPWHEEGEDEPVLGETTAVPPPRVGEYDYRSLRRHVWVVEPAGFPANMIYDRGDGPRVRLINELDCP